MKWQALIVLLAIGIGIFAPPALPMFVCNDGHSSIGTLDVCHSATPALSSNGEMPCAIARPFLPLPLITTEKMLIQYSSLQPFFIIQNQERPPEA
jgi:hypothetical protein